jgi:hypothetical protein
VVVGECEVHHLLVKISTLYDCNEENVTSVCYLTGRISTLPLMATGLSLMAWRPKTAGENYVREMLRRINRKE